MASGESPLRIPFAVAIAEPRLLKPRWDELSKGQQTALKSFYGLPLTDVKDDKGWSEQDYWAAFQGFAEYDILGRITRTLPGAPPPREGEWPEAWVIAGIRSGKSDTFASTIIAYEATCGGHEHWLRRGKRAVCFLIAQDLRFARWSLPGILATLESMSFISGSKGKRQIDRVTADQIDLKNGMSIAVVPPTVKAVRGFDAPVAVMDEVGIWSLTTDAANPDFEVYRQIKSRQAQFSDGKIVAVSSPWVKQGMLWEAQKAGTEGILLPCDVCGVVGGACPACVKMREPHLNRLVIHATTASLGNPLVKATWLREAQQKDPKAFDRECLARFVDALSGFLDPSLLEESVDRGVRERPPSPRAFYVAAIDPAFRQDAFGLCISHIDKDKGVVIDVLRRWPASGEKRDAPLNPSEVLREISLLLPPYRIREVVSDQYHIDTLQQLALNFGFSIRQVTFTGGSKADIYGNLQQVLNQKRLHLLDHPETVRELRMIERRNMPGGTVKIGSPRGEHDDMATVVALAAHQATWLMPTPEPQVKPEPTTFEKIEKHLSSKRRVATAGGGDWAW